MLGRAGNAGSRAKCSGDREAWSLRACVGFISSAMPPPCPGQEARVHMRVDTLPRARMSPRVHGAHQRRRVVAAAARPVSSPRPAPVPPAVHLCALLYIHHSSPFLFTQARKRKRESHENPTLAFLFPHPLPLHSVQRHPRKEQAGLSPALHLSPQSGVFFRVFFISGNCNTQSMLLC